jgi:hypothetical protein
MEPDFHSLLYTGTTSVDQRILRIIQTPLHQS